MKLSLFLFGFIQCIVQFDRKVGEAAEIKEGKYLTELYLRFRDLNPFKITQ